MKKLLLKTWLLLTCLLLGVGTSWAEDTTGTIKFGTNDVKINAASVTGDDDLGNTWTITTVGTTSFTANAAYYQVGASKSPATSITFTTTLSASSTIKSMSAKFGGFSGTAGTVTLKVGSKTVGTGSLNETNDVTVNSTSSATGTTLTVTVTDIAKGVKVYNISYTIGDDESSDPDPITVTAPAFDVAAGTYTEDQRVLIKNYNLDYLYAYTLDGTDPAFDEELNVTTGYKYDNGKGIEITSSCTLKAIAVDEDGNTSEITSAAYVIKPALTSIAVSGTPTKTEYYVGDAFETAGLVVTGTYSDSHQEVITEGIEWTIVPETLTLGATSVDVEAAVGSVVSEVYTVEGLTVTKPDFETVTYNFSSFTSGTSVELTDLDGFVITLKGNGGTNPAWSSNQARVYAKGSLTVKANNATIKSIEYTYAVNAGGKNNVTPTIDGVAGTTNAGTWDAEKKTWTGADEEVTFSTSGTAGNIGFTKLVIKYVESDMILTSLEWSEDAAEVTIGADDNVFPTLTTTPVDLAGVTYESSNTAVATIAADGTITLVKAGETTITASYAGDAEHKPATPDSYTLTVNKAPFVPTPVTEGYETVDFTTIEPYMSLADNGSAEMTTYEGTSFSAEFAKKSGTNNAPKFYQNGNAVRAYVDNTMTIKAAENIQYVDITWVSNYADNEVSITGLGTETAVVTFSKTCRFTTVTVCYGAEITLAATDGSDYYATFSCDKNVVFKDATIYTVSASDNALTLNEVESKEVPANTGVLVKIAATTAAYYYVPSATAVENNDLYPASKDKGELSGYKFYMLNYGASYDPNDPSTFSTLGFYYGEEGGVAFNSREGSAYLAIPTSKNARAGFSFADDAEGLNAIEDNTAATTIYTLEGVKVNELQKGLNIVNGKKVMVK